MDDVSLVDMEQAMDEAGNIALRAFSTSDAHLAWEASRHVPIDKTRPYGAELAAANELLAEMRKALWEAERRARFYQCLVHVSVAKTGQAAAEMMRQHVASEIAIGVDQAMNRPAPTAAGDVLDKMWRALRDGAAGEPFARVEGAIAALAAVGALSETESELWSRRIETCPGHDDEGGRAWCAFCGRMAQAAKETP